MPATTIEPLAPALVKLGEELMSGIPAETAEKLGAALSQVNASFEPKPPAKGAVVPSFELRNATGKTVALSDLLKSNKAVVLTWYRGGWCPYCNLALRALTQANEEIEKLGGKLVCLTPELPDESLSTVEKNELKFEVLSDEGLDVAERYGLTFEMGEIAEVYIKLGINMYEKNGNKGKKPRLPVPATFVLDGQGKVVYSFVEKDYSKRAEPAEIVDAVKKIVA